MKLGNRNLADLSLDEIDAIVATVDETPSDRPLGFEYDEQEIIESLAVCASALPASMDKGNMAAVAEGLNMIRGFLHAAEEMFGKNWVRDRLYLHVLEVSIKKFEETDR